MAHGDLRHFTPRIHGLLIALALVTGCLTADGTLEKDGAASLTMTFPTPATVEEDGAARALVSSPEVTLDSLSIADAAAGERGPRRATAKVSTKDVETIVTLPLMRVLGATIEHERKPDGGGSLRLKLQNPTPRKKDDPEIATMMKFPASVRVRMPGPIVETSGTEKDGAAEWTFPAGDWTAGKRLEFTTSYGPAPEPEAPASGTKGDGPG